MEKNNAICRICGKPYHKCISCKNKLALSPWTLYTDTAEHYQIFQTLRGVNIGVYTKAEAKKMLSGVSLKGLLPEIAAQIRQIQAEPKKKKSEENVN